MAFAAEVEQVILCQPCKFRSVRAMAIQTAAVGERRMDALECVCLSHLFMTTEAEVVGFIGDQFRTHIAVAAMTGEAILPRRRMARGHLEFGGHVGVAIKAQVHRFPGQKGEVARTMGIMAILTGAFDHRCMHVGPLVFRDVMAGQTQLIACGCHLERLVAVGSVMAAFASPFGNRLMKRCRKKARARR